MGASTLDSLTVTTVSGTNTTFNNTPLVRQDNGAAVPITNAGGFDGFFWSNADRSSTLARRTNYLVDDIVIRVELIPEPSTIALLTLALVSWTLAIRRRS